MAVTALVAIVIGGRGVTEPAAAAASSTKSNATVPAAKPTMAMPAIVVPVPVLPSPVTLPPPARPGAVAAVVVLPTTSQSDPASGAPDQSMLAAGVAPGPPLAGTPAAGGAMADGPSAPTAPAAIPAPAATLTSPPTSISGATSTTNSPSPPVVSSPGPRPQSPTGVATPLPARSTTGTTTGPIAAPGSPAIPRSTAAEETASLDVLLFHRLDRSRANETSDAPVDDRDVPSDVAAPATRETSPTAPAPAPRSTTAGAVR